MERNVIISKLNRQLHDCKPESGLHIKLHELLRAWDAMREELEQQVLKLDPSFQWKEWEDGPEEDVLKNFLFWWTWGN